MCLYFRTVEEWTGNRGERGGMTCSKGPHVESNPGPMREDIASVYGAPALPTAPAGAPKLSACVLTLLLFQLLSFNMFFGLPSLLCSHINFFCMLILCSVLFHV